MTGRLIRLPRLEPGTPAWHKQRELAVGGSEIAAVMGFSPWESRFSLWCRKKGLVGPVDDNEAMRWGRLLEAPIAARFAEDHPEWTVRRTGTFSPTGRPYQLVSPDRDVQIGHRQRVPLEIKKSHDGIGWGKAGTDEVPIYYRCQCIWQMDALAADHCYLAVLIAGVEYREYRIGFDQSEANDLLNAAAVFVQSLRAGERPDIDAHGETYQVLRNLHPDINGERVEVGERLARRYVAAQTAKSNAELEAQYATSLLADAMGNAQRATYLDQTLATRQARGDGTPYLVKARSLPEIHSTTTRESAA